MNDIIFGSARMNSVRKSKKNHGKDLKQGRNHSYPSTSVNKVHFSNTINTSFN